MTCHGLISLHIEGFQPECGISTILYHCRNTPFWLETLDMWLYIKYLDSLNPLVFMFFAEQREGEGGEREREDGRSGWSKCKS